MLATRTAEDESLEVEEMDTLEPNWCWFYLAECGVWHMFEIDPSAACSVTSAQIEQCYNRNQRGVMEFYTAKYTYRLDFSVMRQVNLTTGKQRPIKRSLHSATGFRFICDNLALPVPCHWERINTDEPYQLVQLGRDTYEFKEVARLYERTMDRPIKSIQRIQNLDLWEFFCRKKMQLRKVKRTFDIEERRLFHGTGCNNIQAICMFNFDWRLTGSNGDVYGKGSYFARDAKYSSKFCYNTTKHNSNLHRHGLSPPIFAGEPSYKSMFLARVLLRGRHGQPENPRHLRQQSDLPGIPDRVLLRLSPLPIRDERFKRCQGDPVPKSMNFKVPSMRTMTTLQGCFFHCTSKWDIEQMSWKC
ncbi:protein mono-ADP-ribosyltransferase PARP11 isoform X1 [Syngnathus scovelli]|uniref:protein mono-ADP-ribosyltransferase PARP11 isoform X1 n=1 Tax=Syngnathus scovelli TaxID=161590 RepID=UPI00210F6174|nr:protein mono-ADP-ribosyltransferase PARP11 isoform X1 [Syngnathus scovelli]